MDIALNKLPGIGPARLKALEDAGIFSVRQLVEYLPRSYRNLSDRRPLASLKVGDEAAEIAPGTLFEKLPEDWVCPECGEGKDHFIPA